MLNQLLEKLKGSTLISDGRADEVAQDVIIQPGLFKLLLEGLRSEDEVIRGRTAHALEKVARIYPDWFDSYFEEIEKLALDDPIPMVRWHMAMLLTDLAVDTNHNEVMDTLLTCLQDESAFVLSWAISGLCILGRRYPARAPEILKALRPLRNVNGTAIRSRASKAVDSLENPTLPIPRGWIKAK
jgi:hypothetical protein